MIERFQKGSRMAQVVAGATTIHIAGQVADDRKTGIEDQTRQVLAKIDALLAEAGGKKSNLLAVNIFLPHITDFDECDAPPDMRMRRAPKASQRDRDSADSGNRIRRRGNRIGGAQRGSSALATRLGHSPKAGMCRRGGKTAPRRKMAPGPSAASPPRTASAST
jgi:enamine deaminase RidA (YjgF/YER057c/UK114 family)